MTSPATELQLTVAPNAFPRPRVWSGQGVRLSLLARDVATQAAVAATGVEVGVRRPGAATYVRHEQADLTADGTGRWYLDLPADVPGRWRLRAACAGPREAAVEASFDVAPSTVAPEEVEGPLLVTEDGALLATPDSQALTARRIDRLAAASVAAGMVLVGVQDDEARSIPFGFIEAAAVDAAEAAAAPAAVATATVAIAPHLAAAQAAADNTADAVANAAILRATLAELEVAMATSATGALGVVYGDENEGEYRKPASGPLVRVGDTRRQVNLSIAQYDTIEPDAPAIAIVVPDAAGVDRVVASVRRDGRMDVRDLHADALDVSASPFPTLARYEALDNPGDAALITDTDESGVPRILGYVPTNLAGAQAAVPADDIRAWAPGIAQDGVTDVSAMIAEAHAAADAAGLDTLYFEASYNAPGLLYAGNTHFRTRSGKGRLVGAYRKRVLPANLPGLEPLEDMVPARHLRRFLAAIESATPSSPAIVAYMMDSWGHPNQRVGLASQFEHLLRRALRTQFGDLRNRLVVVNRAIGGTTWDDAAGVPGSTTVTWARDPALPWLPYVTNLNLTDIGLGASVAPHLAILGFGMNHGAPANAATLTNMRTVIEAFTTLSPRPDIVLIAGAPPSTMHPTRGAKAGLEARLSMAGLVRSEAAMRDLGLIDWGRQLGALHWGTDERLTYFRRIVTAAATTWPYTWPAETVDFAGSWSAPGQTTTFWSTGGALECTLSSVPGNRLVLERDGASGNVALTVFAGTDMVSVPRFVSSVAAATGAATPSLEICAQGPHLMVAFRNTLIWDGPVHRGGGQHAPVIGFTGGTIALTADFVAVSDHTLVEPSMTAAALWGRTSGGDLGGNGDDEDGNHLSEPGRAAIMAATLNRTRWS
jgi:hypothetical protein